MNFTLFFVGLFLLFDASDAVNQWAEFVFETVGDRSDIISYKKIGTSSYFGLIGQSSKMQCSEICLNEDSCKSFHIDGGACVFGVSGNVTAFEREGENATPDTEQRIFAKRMY